MNKNGFTLIEILVVSAIFGVIMLYSYKLFFTANSNFSKLQNKIDALAEKDRIFENISHKVHATDRIIAGGKNQIILQNKNIMQLFAEPSHTNIFSNDYKLKFADTVISDKIEYLEFFFDKQPPNTSHIIIKLKLLNYDDLFFNSVCLRNKTSIK